MHGQIHNNAKNDEIKLKHKRWRERGHKFEWIVKPNNKKVLYEWKLQVNVSPYFFQFVN